MSSTAKGLRFFRNRAGLLLPRHLHDSKVSFSLLTSIPYPISLKHCLLIFQKSLAAASPAFTVNAPATHVTHLPSGLRVASEVCIVTCAEDDWAVRWVAVVMPS